MDGLELSVSNEEKEKGEGESKPFIFRWKHWHNLTKNVTAIYNF